MTYQRLAYDDQDNALRMQADCLACTEELSLPRRPVDVAAVLDEPPALTYGDFAHDRPKASISVSDAAAHLAARLHLHLD